MSPNDQRIAIAKAVGWKLGTYYMHWNHAPCGVRSYSCERDMLEGVPRYTESLDAMHEAEKVLTPPQRSMYISRLGDISIVRSDAQMIVGGFDYIHAPADMRAEAFLRTLNLWTES